MHLKMDDLVTGRLFNLKKYKYREELTVSINRINVNRGKITSTIFIVMEAIILVASLTLNKSDYAHKTGLYYEIMYTLLIIIMTAYLLIFAKLGKDITKHGTGIKAAGAAFVITILVWCAGISLLDQLSSGQIIVYTVAVIAVASTPVLEPVTLLFIYSAVQILFFIMLPYFQKSNTVLFGNYINSTAFVIISWGISLMRYKNYEEDFNNRKIIQEKSDELNRVNKELEAVNRKLEKLSQTDGLTGTFNRLVFDRTMKTEWDRCRRHLIPLSLIMIDIDFFKAYNDNYGHQAGDNCLRKVSGVLISCARRSSDIVARYGGEEFAVIIPHIGKDKVLQFAEQLRKGVEQLDIPHEYSSVSNHITISLGVHTTIPSEASSVEEFIRIADRALYEAKKKRNNLVAA